MKTAYAIFNDTANHTHALGGISWGFLISFKIGTNFAHQSSYVSTGCALIEVIPQNHVIFFHII